MHSVSILFAAFVASEAFYICLAGGGSGSCGSSVSEAAERLQVLHLAWSF